MLFSGEVVNMVNTLSGKRLYVCPINPTKKVDKDTFFKNLGKVVVEDFKNDKGLRSEWESNCAEVTKLFISAYSKKDFPWEGASNVMLPFITYATIQFQARAYTSIVTPKGLVKIKCFSKNPAVLERAKRVEEFMNFQLLYGIPEFEEGFEKTLIQLPLFGSAFRKTTLDYRTGKPTSTFVSVFDVVVDPNARSLKEASRISHIIRPQLHELRRYVEVGAFTNDALDLMSPSSETLVSEADITVSDETGVSMPQYHNTRTLIEQYRWMDLHGDGNPSLYMIVVDYETQKVLRMVDMKIVNANLEEVEHFNPFTHYVFIPNPVGFYGLGFGVLLRGLNEAANTIVNEVIDAGSLANMQGGFISKTAGIKQADIRFKRGEFKVIDAYVDDLKKAIFSFDFKGPNTTLYSVLGLLYEYSQVVSSISETMTGQLPASDTPASTVLALIEEGRKVFSSIHKRIYRSFQNELKKLYILDRLFLPYVNYYAVVGDNLESSGEMKMLTLKDLNLEDFIEFLKYDFNLDLVIQPVANPEIISRAEKIMKAQQALNEVKSNPILGQNPNSVWVATKYYLEQLEIDVIDELMGEPPRPKDIDPVTENSMYIAGDASEVLPEQNHMEHITTHNELLDGEYNEVLDKGSVAKLKRHIQQHYAMMYLQQKQLEMQQQQQQMQLEGGNGEGGVNYEI